MENNTCQKPNYEKSNFTNRLRNFAEERQNIWENYDGIAKTSFAKNRPKFGKNCFSGINVAPTILEKNKKPYNDKKYNEH